MKQLVLMIAVALSTLSGKAQPFKITTDTIRLDSTKYRYIGMMTDYHDKYFCVVKPTDEEDEKSAIIMIDKHDKTITRLPLPQQWVNEGETRVESMFVRNDSLIIKLYETYEDYMRQYDNYEHAKWFNEATPYQIEEMEQMERLQDHYLNPVTMRWEPAIRAYDEIFSNKEYEVTYKALGEFGGYTIFTERKNGRHHCYYYSGWRLLEKGGKYYLLGGLDIRRINNPKKGVVFTGTNYLTLYINKQYTNAPRIFKVESDSVLFEQMGWEPVTYSKYIRKMYRYKAVISSGFFIKNQLYLLIHSDAGLALASYRKGKISKVVDLFRGYMHLLPMRNYDILNNCIKNYQARHAFYDVTLKTFILVNIDRYDIRLTYFMMS